ncbi:beta-phosphoglucomutase [Aquimarina intermedia]|uniref:Beta-phosphoglucomutase n=2 Tax=Aquimarina intermedia TaxID=350814 RepID=A0A5S5C2K7_9FLAO|nr:beta-phosphoglucomutase [Aquimarina intermedia]
MMNKKGFIFDLDGVIVDTAKYHYLAWKNLAEELGISFSEIQNEQLKGVSRIRSLEKILEWGNLEIPQDKFDKLLVEKNEEYLSYINNMNQNEILPDAVRVLEYLKTQNCGIALGSASKNARIILDKVNLREHFETIIDGTDVTKAKPDPEVFIKGAERLNIAPEHCVVFEDSVAGIQAANAAGMVSIGIGDSAILYEADYVFENFKEMDNQFINQLITTEKV